ncbi:MAG: branched-chain amino acid ABC transporter permease, partial [Firmicutes bacterium]|nr:branched-chain amino acid ABC transporter permease [Bacillota bacterium]
GFTGMFTMGHAGFMAIGAYTSAVLAVKLGVPIPVSMLAGTVLAVIVGVIVSLPTLKLRDDYFMIVTLGVGEGIRLIIQYMEPVTGGARGLTGIPHATDFPQAFILLILTIVFIKSFLSTKYGRSCIAIREEELAAKSIGINVFRHRLMAIVISCALCGLSGALLAHYMNYLNPTLFKLAKSEELTIAVILGGRGSLTGSIIAGLVLLPLPEVLRFGSAQEWRMVLYGFLVIITIIFKPSGLMGTNELTLASIKNGLAWVRARLGKKDAAKAGEEADGNE